MSDDVEQPQEQEEPRFPGFIHSPKNRFSQISNDWFDEIVSQIDNVAELKIVLYVFRHTCGFQKPTTLVPLIIEEFMVGRTKSNGDRYDRGTGMSEMSVRNGIKKAVKHGYIICETDNSNKGSIKKSYKLRFQEVQSLDLDTTEGQSEVQSLDLNGRSEVQSLGKSPHNLDPKHLNCVPQMSSKEGGKEKERQLNKNNRNTDVDSSINKIIDFPEQNASQRGLSQETISHIRGIAKDWGGNEDKAVLQAQELYRLSGISDNAFYNDTFRAIAQMRVKRPRDEERMQCFLDCLRKLSVKQTTTAMEG